MGNSHAIKLFLPLIFILLGSATQCNKQETSFSTNVFVVEGIRLRRSPTMESPSLATIPYATTLIVKSDPKDLKETIAGVPGHWRFTSYGSASGWVFDGFLSSLHPPRLGLCHSLEDYAQQVGMVGNRKEFVQHAVSGRFVATNLTVEQIPMATAIEYSVRNEQPLAANLLLAQEKHYEGSASYVYSKEHSERELFLLGRLCLPNTHVKYINQLDFTKHRTSQPSQASVYMQCIGNTISTYPQDYGLSLIVGTDPNLGAYIKYYIYYMC